MKIIQKNFIHKGLESSSITLSYVRNIQVIIRFLILLIWWCGPLIPTFRWLRQKKINLKSPWITKVGKPKDWERTIPGRVVFSLLKQQHILGKKMRRKSGWQSLQFMKYNKEICYKIQWVYHYAIEGQWTPEWQWLKQNCFPSVFHFQKIRILSNC